MPLSYLMWLNFFIADVQDGLGPYLGVFLKQKGFLDLDIGIISTAASLIALAFLVPLGNIIDKTHHKLSLITLCIVIISSSTLINYFYHHFYLTLLVQISIALCGAFLSPAINAITLGMTAHNLYAKQISKNEIYKHAGTCFSAMISFIGALYYGIVAIFVITAIMGVVSLIFTYKLKKVKIDHNAARGAHINKPISSLKSIFVSTPILLLALICFCFHLSNAYMLPLLSQRALSMGIDSSGSYAAMTILIAQGVMILIAYICSKLFSKTKNTGKLGITLIGIGLFELIIRGMIAAFYDGILAMIIVQILDGIGAGIIGVALPILIANILQGSGHINAGLSFIITIGSIGGALSSSLGGFNVQYFGYFYAYMILSLIALLGFVLWLLSHKFIIRSS